MGDEPSKESQQQTETDAIVEHITYDDKGDKTIEVIEKGKVVKSTKYDNKGRVIEVIENGKVVQSNVYKLNANDNESINYAIDTINKHSKDCKLKIVVDKVNNKVYYPDYEKIKHYINFIGDLQLGHQYSGFPIKYIPYGTFFGQYGLGNNRSYEYTYIIAFLLGCKDFIGATKCAYNSRSDFLDNLGNSYSWYQVMSIIVNYLNNKNKDEKKLYVASPDPYPNFMNHDKKVCEKKPKNDTPYHHIFSLSANDVIDEQKNSQKNSHKHIMMTLMATLLFIILSNMLTYGFTNSIFKITINNEGNPSEIGILLHAVVFFGLFYICYNLIRA